VGLPFTEAALSNTPGGGTPYGASHVAGPGARPELLPAEAELARVLGARVAALALRLAQPDP